MPLAESFSGGCLCGSVRYQVEGRVRYMGNCHCRDCQQATGSAYLAAVGVKTADFKVTKGEAKWFVSKADNGHDMRRAFCPDCGSPVFLENTVNSHLTVLYAGSLDDPSWYEPGRDIFVSSAQPWNPMNMELPKHDKMPEMPK
jgi:hypothetical protein